jgi:hypothetical protein
MARMKASRDVVGAERCVFGMPFLQADFDAEGRLDGTIGAAAVAGGARPWWSPAACWNPTS